jgi:hypothetical protein
MHEEQPASQALRSETLCGKSCKKEPQLCDVMGERQLEVDKQNWWQTPPTLKSGLKPKNKI